jgi:menin
LTSNRLTTTTNDSQQIDLLTNFPVVNLELVETLYKKFQTILTTREIVHKHSTKATRQNIQNKDESDETTRDIIKKINDIIWFSLLKSSHKDRAHLQSLYSYLNESKLDCFGVGLTTLAGCQLLGYKDVNLALSEDHVWLVFGKTGGETIEITWHGHGKGSEDKRGQSVGLESQTWIYVNGFPVVCNRFMEVAAMVSAINPSLTQSSACLEVADMQQQLLWMLYDLDALSCYPMALSCLAELEEVSQTPNRPSSEDLYIKSVLAGKTFYKNHHVYPSIALAGYYYRKSNYKKAFNAWADAGDVIRL